LPSQKGSLAQLVQSICLTSRGSAVRSRQLPRNARIFPGFFYVEAVPCLRDAPPEQLQSGRNQAGIPSTPTNTPLLRGFSIFIWPMNNRGLIFIPDISGFTKFVNEVEIDHSRHIIQELLEVVINANQIGLEISEIEGDAILFYKYGDPPQLKELYSQVEKMFCAFHKHLKAYDNRRFCQCTACCGAINLSLKVITHYGEFTGYNVKNFSKLIGKDIIVAHQLLKNDVEQHEYWLVTPGVSGEKIPEELGQRLHWYKSEKQTETGVIPFQYAQLGYLKDNLHPDPPVDYGIKNRVKQLSLTREYNTDIISLLHAVADFNTRNQWQVGVRGVDNVSDPVLPRLGTHHRCLLENGSTIMYSSNYFFSTEKIVYGETDNKKKAAIDFTMEYITRERTRLTLDFYLRKNPFLQLAFNTFMKKKTKRNFEKSLANLEEFVKREFPPDPDKYPVAC
jgi:hypothetical protein